MSSSQTTLLLTRPKEASLRFLEQLDQALLDRVRVCISPLIRIEALEAPINWAGVKGVIFTSANGVKAAEPHHPAGILPAYCVGAATTRAAEQSGWLARQVGEDARSLMAGLLEDQPPGPLLHVRGRHARGDIAQSLSKAGLPTNEWVLYDQVAQDLTSEARDILSTGETIIAPLFSPRTAQLFADAVHGARVTCAAISAAVAAQTAGHKALQISIAERPDARSMAQLVEKLLRDSLSG